MTTSDSTPPDVPHRALDQQVFDEWPAAARALLDGSSLADKGGFTASLLTVDANGHLRTSLLGVGEMLAPDSRTLCVALWPQSRAARALAERGRAAVSFVCEDAFYQVQLQFAPLPDLDKEDEDNDNDAPNDLARFIGSIDTGDAQRVRYARLTSGISFELEGDRETVLDRWEQQIEHLKKAAARASR